jgi:folate-dependent phosphoribosylglycinamide formyltransferase PurN
LLDSHDVVGIVIERRAPALSSKEKYDRRRKLLQRHGLGRTVNKLLYNWFRSRFISPAEATAVRELFFPDQIPVAYSRDVPTETVADINDARCSDFIKRLGPDVIAVCGTTVIRPEIFSLAPLGALNIHTGITPDYRSADPIFWAIYHNDLEKVGVTIHFVDRGIDTGPIIYQEKVPVYAGDSLVSVYCRCVRRGAELYLRALGEVANRTVRTLDRSGAPSRAFYSIDLGIVQYLRFRARFRKLAAGLPRAPTASSASRSGKGSICG